MERPGVRSRRRRRRRHPEPKPNRQVGRESTTERAITRAPLGSPKELSAWLGRTLRKTQDAKVQLDPHPVIYVAEAHAEKLRDALPVDAVTVTTRAEFAAEIAKLGAIAFVDYDLLRQIERDLNGVPVVAVLDVAPAEVLVKTIQAYDAHPWLSHVVAVPLFAQEFARAHLTMLVDRLSHVPEPRALGDHGVGRMALLARASKREQRLERLREFFGSNGLSARTVQVIADVAEELITNALYDAPAEARYFDHAISRTEDVELPADRACEISYGIEDGMIFVRLRDTFGSLSRARLLNVLNRCSSNAVELDESRGGAGLGLWRVFTSASTLALTVIPGCLTDIAVGIATTANGRAAKQLQAVHLFFGAKRLDLSTLVPHDDRDLTENSITLVVGPGHQIPS